MSKNVKEHEDINLHIKKTTFERILRAVFIMPLYCYCLIGFWFGLSEKYNVPNFFAWWTPAPTFVWTGFMLCVGYLVVAFILWDIEWWGE